MTIFLLKSILALKRIRKRLPLVLPLANHSTVSERFDHHAKGRQDDQTESCLDAHAAHPAQLTLLKDDFSSVLQRNWLQVVFYVAEENPFQAGEGGRLLFSNGHIKGEERPEEAGNGDGGGLLSPGESTVASSVLLPVLLQHRCLVEERLVSSSLLRGVPVGHQLQIEQQGNQRTVASMQAVVVGLAPVPESAHKVLVKKHEED